VKVALVSPPKY